MCEQLRYTGDALLQDCHEMSFCLCECLMCSLRRGRRMEETGTENHVCSQGHGRLVRQRVDGREARGRGGRARALDDTFAGVSLALSMTQMTRTKKKERTRRRRQRIPVAVVRMEWNHPSVMAPHAGPSGDSWRRENA